MTKLSVVLAVRNEEKNIGECLSSIKGTADEIVVVDEESKDNTIEIVRSFGARIIKVEHSPIFHISKQKALEEANGEWILQLDADERVTPKLAEEIRRVIEMPDNKIDEYQKTLKNQRLFARHKRLIEKRDGAFIKEGEFAGFFIPRLNYFLGKYLRYGGVYPDGVIRLVKKEKAHFPQKSVHELIKVDGKVGWLQNDLIHMADPTFSRYLQRNSYYIDLIADDMKNENLGKSVWQFLNYVLVKPIWWFFLTLFRHKGILDGFQGIIFSFFSALRFPRAYLRYLRK
ncbi:MAG: Glycosyl transferase, family 2 [Candidatus Woesebacteria bacterium GW2011_GWA1_39_12]|uniref:Glycosyl transferase, family 2 n=1 Tax=Candidatus Woesebacteria bacterium GW2011_GWA1_39_12 TaxID=1618549 RepID=A0A0G0Q667_9BACT|nr:MAG: Glycosyl transferase, family 2 [Candidatus Woesebacteria bacterium GW2011_GWA1_39_12]